MVGFTYGSFKVLNGNLCKVRMGGYLIDKKVTLEFVFSYPCIVESALQAEIEAIKYLAKVLSWMVEQAYIMVIHIDSILAVKKRILKQVLKTL